MLLKSVFVLGSVLAQEEQRELKAAEAVSDEFYEFHMEHASEEGYKFHFANYGLDWGQIYGMADEVN